MVTAIELDHEPVCRTAEIHDVRTNGVLPTKLGVMELPVTQLPPEYPLTVGLPPAKPSGKPTAPAPLTRPLSPSRGEGFFTPLPHRFYPEDERGQAPPGTAEPVPSSASRDTLR